MFRVITGHYEVQSRRYDEWGCLHVRLEAGPYKTIRGAIKWATALAAAAPETTEVEYSVVFIRPDGSKPEVKQSIKNTKSTAPKGVEPMSLVTVKEFGPYDFNGNPTGYKVVTSLHGIETLYRYVADIYKEGRLHSHMRKAANKKADELNAMSVKEFSEFITANLKSFPINE